MEHIQVRIAGGVLFLVGLLLLFFGKGKGGKKTGYYNLEKEVTDLMYEQHKLLLLVSSHLVDQVKIEETYFFEKKKFLNNVVNKEQLQQFLIKGKEDMQFLNGLKKI